MEVSVAAAAILAVLATATALKPDNVATVEIVADSETVTTARLELLADGVMVATIGIALSARRLTIVFEVTEIAIRAETV